MRFLRRLGGDPIIVNKKPMRKILILQLIICFIFLVVQFLMCIYDNNYSRTIISFVGWILLSFKVVEEFFQEKKK